MFSRHLAELKRLQLFQFCPENRRHKVVRFAILRTRDHVYIPPAIQALYNHRHIAMPNHVILHQKPRNSSVAIEEWVDVQEIGSHLTGSNKRMETPLPSDLVSPLGEASHACRDLVVVREDAQGVTLDTYGG